MENKSKAETLIGFAIRAGKVKMGTNAVATLKHADLIIACKSGSENAIKTGLKFANRFKCKLLITKNKLLEEIVYKKNVKIMAITDRNFAKSITEYSESEFIIQNQENV